MSLSGGSQVNRTLKAIAYLGIVGLGLFVDLVYYSGADQLAAVWSEFTNRRRLEKIHKRLSEHRQALVPLRSWIGINCANKSTSCDVPLLREAAKLSHCDSFSAQFILEHSPFDFLPPKGEENNPQLDPVSQSLLTRTTLDFAFHLRITQPCERTVDFQAALTCPSGFAKIEEIGACNYQLRSDQLEYEARQAKAKVEHQVQAQKLRVLQLAEQKRQVLEDEKFTRELSGQQIPAPVQAHMKFFAAPNEVVEMLHKTKWKASKLGRESIGPVNQGFKCFQSKSFVVYTIPDQDGPSDSTFLKPRKKATTCQLLRSEKLTAVDYANDADRLDFVDPKSDLGLTSQGTSSMQTVSLVDFASKNVFFSTGEQLAGVMIEGHLMVNPSLPLSDITDKTRAKYGDKIPKCRERTAEERDGFSPMLIAEQVYDSQKQTVTYRNFRCEYVYSE